MAARRQSLDQFCHECMIDDTKDGKISAFALVHIKGSQEIELCTIQLGAKQWTGKELGTMFYTKAENHAEGLIGVQSYLLLAHYSDRKEPQAQKPFLVNGASEHEGLSTEGPTSSGLTQQAMRHTEAMIQMCFRQTAMLFTASNETAQTLIRQNQQLMQENKDAFDIVKQVMMQQVQAQNEQKTKHLEYERSSNERAKWMTMIPLLVNQLTGRDVFPQETGDTALVEMLADRIDPKILPALVQAGAIDEETMGLLSARLAKHLKKKRENQEMVMANTKDLDPELDAVGGINH